MLTEKFLEVLKHDGVVTIVTQGENEPHLVNTWNDFLVVTEDQRILIPAAAMNKTEKNALAHDNKIKLALGTRQVKGFKDYPGTGFVVEGKANFLSEGEDFDLMKEKFDFLSRVLEITVTSCKQMI